MTIATDLGFKIGELYRVVDTKSGYYEKGEIVRFVKDDGSAIPWFMKESEPLGPYNTDNQRIAVELAHLVPLEQTKTPERSQYYLASNKPILLLYIQQQYPDDKVLKVMVESI